MCALRNSMKNYGHLGSEVHSFWQILLWAFQVRENNIQNISSVYCRRKGWAFRLGWGLAAWARVGIAADTEEPDVSPPYV